MTAADRSPPYSMAVQIIPAAASRASVARNSIKVQEPCYALDKLRIG
jgi:hypothetical protein